MTTLIELHQKLQDKVVGIARNVRMQCEWVSWRGVKVASGSGSGRSNEV